MGCPKLTYFENSSTLKVAYRSALAVEKPCTRLFIFNRKSSAGVYRYGFNEMEKDDEIKGNGNSVNYKYRMHDPRLGRFFALDPLATEYPHNSPYAFSENRVIDAFELEGLEAWIYTETDGVGHVFIAVPSDDDVSSLTVYTYGRYNGSTTPSSGGFGPVGDGVLIRYTGRKATDFISDRLMIGGGGSTFAFELPKADATKIRNYYDKMFEAGDELDKDSKAYKKYGNNARVIDQYKLSRIAGQKASNCVTKTCEGMIEGEALDEFTPDGQGGRNDGGAYIDLKNQIDPKSFGMFLYLMSRQDAQENPNDRNIKTIVPNEN